MKNPRVLTSFLFALAVAIGFAQAPPNFRSLEKFRPSASTKSTVNPAAKTNTISKPMRSGNYAWNTNNSTWVFSDSSSYTYTPIGWLSSEVKKTVAPTTRTTYTYDSQNRLTNKFTETWNAITNLWMNTNRETWIYDSHGNLTSDTYETFSGSAWVIQSASQYIFTYDANNNLIDYISQNWNTSTQIWNDYHHQMGFLYDANGNCTQYEVQYKLNGNWVNMDRFTYTYVNNVPTDVLTQHWNGTSYINDERMVNITWHSWNGVFSNQTAVTTCTIEDWGGSTWYTDIRINVTYDNFGGSVEVDQSYNGSTWDNTYRYKTNYDSQYNYTGKSLELWSSPVWDLYSEDKIINTYDADFNFTQQVWQYWDDFGSQMENLEKRIYVGYGVFAGVEEQKQSALVSVFPNPSNGEFMVECEYKTNMVIRNTLGQIILEKKLNEGVNKVDMSVYATGIYFLEMNQINGQVKIVKLVKE